MLRGLAATAGAIVAAACVPELPGRGPGPRTFRLTPKTTFPPDLPRVAWSLAVAEPTAEQALDTTRIAVLTGGTAVDYVARATWVDRAPAMVQALIVQSFQASSTVAAVGTDRDRLRAQYLLRSELRAFQLNRGGDGAGTVRVRLDPTLLRLPRREPVGRTSLAAEVAPDAAGTDATIAAFDTALGKVLRELVAWTLRTGESAAA
ncbi:MAG TPA: ABC-type transport auxiliary lipoprotein family protein [Geminicoccaceae bacterium]|nr:ABC-type transport auxiliary lipoprotein family protein [Geminicoccaceae bacterium]